MADDELRELNAAREPVAEESYADWRRRQSERPLWWRRFLWWWRGLWVK